MENFKPFYTITSKLLTNIKQINTLVLELNYHLFPKTVLVRLEKEAVEISSFASTSIEGNPLPLTDVKRILKTKPENIRKSEREVLNYNNILKKLNQRLAKQPLSLNFNLILDVQKQVTDKLIPAYQSGHWRKEAVFVNNPKTGKTIYWPPDFQDVPDLIQALIKFVNHKEPVDPLILAGIFHKQFVIIHPFMDGNGRTARLLTKIMLAQMGLNTFNLFSFENYYNQNVTRYFNEVGVFGNYYDLIKTVDFTSWLEYFTEGIINELLRVKKELEAQSLTPASELKPWEKQILVFIKENGYITQRQYAKLTARAKATRILDFAKLLRRNLIKKRGKGRATYYQ